MRAALRSWLCMCGLGLLGCDSGRIDVLTPVDVPLLPQNTTTKLLHWGGGIPSGGAELAWFVQELAEVEQSPFDGTVLDLGVSSGWLGAALDRAELDANAALLGSAPWGRFTDNFQLLGFSPVPFHDDAAWLVIAENATLLARVSRAAGLRGFLLDTQQYGDYIWSHARLPAQALSFDATQQLVFTRGHQLMSALLEGDPEVSVLLTLATSEVFREVCLSGVTLEDSDYALLPAFLDGMHAARDEARSSAQLIDGFLPAYSTRDPAAYRLYHDLIHGNWQALQDHWRPGIVTYRWATGESDQSAGESVWPDAPELRCNETERLLLTRDVTASFAVMLDYPSPGQSMLPFRTDAAGFSENTHTPQQYTALLRSALQASDRYVWSWTSGLLWWTKPGDDRPLVPAAYVEAARVAREQALGTRF